MPFAEVTIESMSGGFIFFWYGDTDGDAQVIGGKVQDAMLNAPSGLELTRDAERYIVRTLQEWLDEKGGKDAS